jgi:hypothetical protein
MDSVNRSGPLAPLKHRTGKVRLIHRSTRGSHGRFGELILVAYLTDSVKVYRKAGIQIRLYVSDALNLHFITSAAG